MYNQTQYGKLIFGITLVFIALILMFYNEIKKSDPSGEIAALSTAGAFVLLTLLVYRLKVEVNAQEIIISFGVGLIKKRIQIKNIKSAEEVKNKFWYGWGIRYTPHGWLWNISGYEAVEISYKNSDKKFRIGCKNSAELKAAIERNMFNES